MTEEKPRLNRRARARLIATRLGEGVSTEAIAAELGITRTRVAQIASRFAIPLARPHTVRFAFHTPRRRARIIKELAQQAGVSPSTMIDRIVSTVIDEGHEIATRKLGKLVVAGKNGGGK